jgi:hypothetical protein
MYCFPQAGVEEPFCQGLGITLYRAVRRLDHELDRGDAEPTAGMC